MEAKRRESFNKEGVTHDAEKNQKARTENCSWDLSSEALSYLGENNFG